MHTKLAQPILLPRNARRVACRGCPGYGATDSARQRLIYDTDRGGRVSTYRVAQLGPTWPLDHFYAPGPKHRQHFIETVLRHIGCDQRQLYLVLQRLDPYAFSPHNYKSSANTKPYQRQHFPTRRVV
jgi:hypothetical protein